MMQLRKQLQFDITNFRLNKAKYLFYLLEGFYFLMLCIYPTAMQDKFIIAIQVIQLVASVAFLLTVTTVLEGKGFENSINKLIYFPVSKTLFLVSKCILIIVLALLQCVIAYVGLSIGGLLTGGVVVGVVEIYYFTFIASILSFSIFFGFRSLRIWVVLISFETPMCVLLLGDVFRAGFNVFSMSIFLFLLVVNIIVNGISFAKV